MDTLILVAVIVFILIGLVLIVLWLTSPRSVETGGTELIRKAEKEQAENPDKNRPIYDEAYGRLMDYIQNNFRQNKNIFNLTVFIILVGFIMIGVGIGMSTLPGQAQAWPAIVAGAVTEFIAATVLFVYKSVSQQSTDYSRTLERMTSIRMAIQVLDDLADDPAGNGTAELRAQTKAEVAKLLLQLQHGVWQPPENNGM